MAKFLITPTTQNQITVTARLGGNAAGTRANDNDVGKGVKLVGDSNYGLLAAADAIEGVITSVETGVYDGYSLGGVQSKGYIDATAYRQHVLRIEPEASYTWHGSDHSRPVRFGCGPCCDSG